MEDPVLNSRIVTVDGVDFLIQHIFDGDADAPWELNYSDAVTDWTTRSKMPGEQILCEDHGFYRYFDMDKAVECLGREFAARNSDDPVATKKSEKDLTDVALRQYEYFRAWYKDQWIYILIEATPLNDNGEALRDYSSVICGVVFDCVSDSGDEHIQSLEQELIENSWCKLNETTGLSTN